MAKDGGRAVTAGRKPEVLTSGSRAAPSDRDGSAVRHAPPNLPPILLRFSRGSGLTRPLHAGSLGLAGMLLAPARDRRQTRGPPLPMLCRMFDFQEPTAGHSVVHNAALMLLTMTPRVAACPATSGLAHITRMSGSSGQAHVASWTRVEAVAVAASVETRSPPARLRLPPISTSSFITFHICSTSTTTTRATCHLSFEATGSCRAAIVHLSVASCSRATRLAR